MHVKKWENMYDMPNDIEKDGKEREKMHVRWVLPRCLLMYAC